MHLHALDLRLRGNVLRSGFVSNLLDMSNHNKWVLHLIVMAMAIEKMGLMATSEGVHIALTIARKNFCKKVTLPS